MTYLIVEPLADEMDANTRYHGGIVLEAHGGQVQTAAHNTSWFNNRDHRKQEKKFGKFVYLFVAMK